MDTPLSIEPVQLRDWIAAGKTLALVDVRDGWELEICRLPGCMSVPLAELPQRAAEIPQDRPVVVICHHGMRSLHAVNWLRRNGVAQAVNLTGGMDAWARQVDPKMGVY